MPPFIIRGAILNPVDPHHAEWIPEGAIAVSAEGWIEYAGPAGQLPEQFHSHPSRDFTGHVIAPGFVDIHTHLPQFHARGKFGASLLEWLERFIYPAEAQLRDANTARETAVDFFNELRRCGTTTAMVYAPSYLAAAECAFAEAVRSRLRIIMGKTQMDRYIPPALIEETSTSLRETEELIRRWHRKTDRIWYAVTPRFAPACSMELMKGCGELAGKYQTYIQTHINETREEIEQVAALFIGRRHYTDVYREAGLLTPFTILAHNLHPVEEELDLCERYRIAVAHCPDSNLFLGSGRFPLERYERTSIRFGLGSDVGAGTTLDMFTVMRSMSHAQGSSLHPSGMLYYATLGGARALSLDHLAGSFAPGKAFDAVILPWSSVNSRMPVDSVGSTVAASTYVYLGEAEKIEEIYVQGEKVGKGEDIYE